MRYGDIGAHHLLRGLNWCYDACRDTMTPDEERRLREVIVRRAEQFHERLNPFRGGEQPRVAPGVRAGRVGRRAVGRARCRRRVDRARPPIVLGTVPRLGRQGENNEGISYWGYGLGFIIGYADMMRAACEIDLYQHPWLRQTARFPDVLRARAWAVSFADTGKPNHAVRGPAQTRWVRELALRTSDPYVVVCDASGQRISRSRRPTWAPSIHYRHIGWVIFNTSLVDGSRSDRRLAQRPLFRRTPAPRPKTAL